ncbi:MAG TPA: fused MFS/spermidine synthase [Candidatus Methanoperedens sp.]|nr:fused MFS/spermidine synthase [Candidatus Methanoperedens sp.]
MGTSDASGAAPRGSTAFLVATALVCGALVMMVEVLGSRVIGPFFGVSLFVWTALIAVTLLALAAGYAAGGVLADRRGADALYGIILVSGLLVALIPPLKIPVLRLCGGLGLRTGALASAAVLFGPALFCLGCVSPFLARLATRELRSLGRTVGLLYALSTAGSFAGTVLAGFVLIEYAGVDATFFALGATLVALGLVWFVALRRTFATLAAALPLLLLVPAADAPVAKTLPDGVRATRIVNRDTFYGNLKVIDYDYGATRTRALLIDGQTQGGIDLADGRSPYAYAYFLQRLPTALRPGGRRCLVIGLGAGAVPRWYEEQGIATDVVDINPGVFALARSHFGYRAAGRAIVSDARSFLREGSERYDYVILDVFNGDTTPSHLVSLEAFALLRARLAPDGVLAMNLLGAVRGPETFGTASVVHTLERVFASVELYPGFPASAESGNITVIARASGGPLDLARVSLAGVHPFALPEVLPYLGVRFRFPAGTPATVLIDDYNPLDLLELALKERERRDILRYGDWDLLL